MRRGAGLRPPAALERLRRRRCSASFFVALAGNLDGVGQLVDRLSAVSTWHVDTPVPLLDAVVNSVGGLWQVVVPRRRPAATFDFWRSSRMLPPTISITEFPYFSFLFADLHAHMMAIPFQVLAIGVGLALALGRRGERDGWREWALVALLGLIVGSLRWLNSWDYPPFLLLALAASLISERRARGRRRGRRSQRLVGQGAAAGRALVRCCISPSCANYQTPVSGLSAIAGDDAAAPVPGALRRLRRR